MAALTFQADNRQSQSLSPRLQQAVRLLQVSSQDFAATVNTTLGRNPFLELEEHDGEAESASETSAETSASADDEAPVSASAPDGDEAGIEGLLGDDRDLWLLGSGTSAPGAADGERSAVAMTEAPISLADHLHAQLGVLPLLARELLLARVVVESLDDDGYLRTPLEELLEIADLAPPVALAEMQAALKNIQALEPAGVAARSVAECLQLQLHMIDCPQLRSLADTIVGKHLAVLAARDVDGLARHLGETPARVDAACARIRRLDPRPGWRFSSMRVDYIVPDVVVKKFRGQWRVQLNPAIVPRVRINKVYAELFRRHRTPDHTEMANHLQEAQWTVRNAELRFSTILAVAEAIVRRQHHFLEYGAMGMKPLSLREIADELGVHESTVSRVTNNKYLSTPAGVFELKHFFSRAMVSANGSACSGLAIRGLIKDIIDTEAREAPKSDVQITQELAEQGLVVARRTVTKYRQLLHIDAVERRRRCAPRVA